MTGEKKAFRINIVDVLITLIIVAMLTVGILMLANTFDVRASGDGNATVEYTVQFKKVRNEFIGNVKAGDIAVDAQNRQNLGVVIDVKDDTPYTIELYNAATDAREVVEYPDFINITMKVSADAYTSDGMWYLKESGREIGIGAEFNIYLPDFCGTGYVSEMNIVKGGEQ
ncbi:MAG: DUF4330 domain-containing protein [Clostridia bacterium]|nr:DUF4330 domain-containing protein [Clostridia bacterium]